MARADRKHFAGDELSITATADVSLATSRVRATVKRLRADADADALAQLDSDNPPASMDDGAIEISGSSVRAWFSSPQTEDWPIAPLWYDVQQVTADGEVHTLAHGLLQMRRRPTRTRTTAPPGPLEIFAASELGFWLPVETWTAASWPDITGNLTLAQAASAKQFTAAQGIGGVDTVLADGVDDHMVGDMTTPFALGSEPVLWGLFRHASTPPSPGSALWRMFTAGTFNNATFQLSWLTGSNRFSATFGIPAVTYGVTPPDTLAHYIEMRYASSGDRALLDGAAMPLISGSPPAVTAFLQGRLQVGATTVAGNAANFANAHYRDLVGARSATDAQRTAMTRWLHYRATGVVL